MRDSDAERILDLKADLVCVAPYNSAGTSSRCSSCSGLATYRNEGNTSIDAIEAGILALGDRVSEPTRAEAIVGRMRPRRQRLAERLRGVSETAARSLLVGAASRPGRNSTDRRRDP